MADDPNNPAAATGTAAPAPVLVDPKTGAPISPRATMTLDDWAVIDTSLADKVAPFKALFASGAEQLMDRATLELRLKTLAEQPPPPPTTPAPDPNAPATAPAA